uniref:Uncharacterized protein n=1 Tax=Triticum urartu TaxID=4572 RepID=A0A8R7VGP1_TRIUA
MASMMDWILPCTSHVALRGWLPSTRASRDVRNRSVRLNPDMRSIALSSSSRYSALCWHRSPTETLMMTSFIMTFTLLPTSTRAPASATDRTSLAASSSRTGRNERTRLGLSSSTVHSFRTAFQCRLSWRANEMFWPPLVKTSAVVYTGRFAMAALWTFITCLAASAEESTSVRTWPRRRSITGPCRRERLRMAWCGRAPSRKCMWPITGSAHGPGGRFGRLPEAGLSVRSTVTTRTQRKM